MRVLLLLAAVALAGCERVPVSSPAGEDPPARGERRRGDAKATQTGGQPATKRPPEGFDTKDPVKAGQWILDQVAATPAPPKGNDVAARAIREELAARLETLIGVAVEYEVECAGVDHRGLVGVRRILIRKDGLRQEHLAFVTTRPIPAAKSKADSVIPPGKGNREEHAEYFPADDAPWLRTVAAGDKLILSGTISGIDLGNRPRLHFAEYTIRPAR